MTIETDCGFGYWDEEGRLTLQTKSICVYRHAMMIARGLGVPPSKIRVIQNNMGATFGYKVAPTNEPLLGACVIATGRPVYMRLNMKEHIVRTPKRSPFLMKVRVGADEKGKLVGLEHHWYVDHGPYSESSQDLTNRVASSSAPPIAWTTSGEPATPFSPTRNGAAPSGPTADPRHTLQANRSSTCLRKRWGWTLWTSARST
jgi:CO/xanthine dehydrogenase Mo-binding subunit